MPPSLRFSCLLWVFCFLFMDSLFSQSLPTPNILEVVEDDRVATLYWNSKTQTYRSPYDPDKQAGIYSYWVEWGKESEGFTQSAVTPYRAHMIQPLEPGIPYIARVYHLDKDGKKSSPSAPVVFEHDGSRVDAMRTRLNGFFDDMNYPMGAFPEKDWNQAYSGCTSNGKLSQHINNQFHGHNVAASGYCDRGIACSRLRHPFDFTGRTGTIEFDLDGSQKTRQLWYLDLMPFDRKRDLGGHVALDLSDPPPADPPHMLRILEVGSSVHVQIADAQGKLRDLPNRYRNGACGESLEWCTGENLAPLINVRRRWKILLSKTAIKIFINGILVVDASLITPDTPNGLTFEVAQINWILFSYNTTKENILLSMIHWDNFGIDAPSGYAPTTVVHNYTDGQLGSEAGRTGNEQSVGMTSSLTDPGISIIPIPDPIRDQGGNFPLETDLMFTLQGGAYSWTPQDSIRVNGHFYSFPRPTSSIPDLSLSELINTTRPYSVVLPINPAHLTTGDNEIQFFLSNPRLLNIHIELTYPILQAPHFTPPSVIYSDHHQKLMAFRTPADTVGPGIVFGEMDGEAFWQYESETNPRAGVDRQYRKPTPVSDSVELQISGNSVAQLAATGKAKGIAYYEICIDSVVANTIRLDEEHPVAGFSHNVKLDVSGLSDGPHELFVRAYDVAGNASQFDAFSANSLPGEYMPTIIDIQNSTVLAVEYVSFIAFEHRGLVQLEWETAREEGSDHFSIERSRDGRAFEPIGEVRAQGTAGSYAYTDSEVSNGTFYYRLKEVDFDGNHTYSEIREVTLSGEMILGISPNPMDEFVEVSVKGTGQAGFILKLTDLTGRVLYATKGRSSPAVQQIFRFPTQHLSTGIYVCKLQAGTQTLYEKVVKR